MVGPPGGPAPVPGVAPGRDGRRRTQCGRPSAFPPILVIGLVGLLLGASLPLAGFSSRPAERIATSVAHLASELVLTLIPSPAAGSAPLLANVSVTVSGGHAPFNVSLCFGVADHQSPTANCGTGATGWSGTSDLHFAHLYSSPGNFSVTGIATDGAGDGVGSTALIVVTPPSVLNATVDERTTTGNAPLAVTFNESVAGGTLPITLQWAFGDGTSGSELPGVPVTHVYRAVGTFTPILTVADGAGHRTVRSAGPVTVTAAPGTPFPGSVGMPSPLELGGAFVATALALGVLVPLLQRRRWRREGNALVDELEHDLADRSPPRRPP